MAAQSCRWQWHITKLLQPDWVFIKGRTTQPPARLAVKLGACTAVQACWPCAKQEEANMNRGLFHAAILF